MAGFFAWTRPTIMEPKYTYVFLFQLHARFDEMKISVSDEKKTVEEQRRQLEDQIADFQRRKVQYENDKMDKGHHTLTLGKLGKKNK